MKNLILFFTLFVASFSASGQFQFAAPGTYRNVNATPGPIEHWKYNPSTKAPWTNTAAVLAAVPTSERFSGQIFLVGDPYLVYTFASVANVASATLTLANSGSTGWPLTGSAATTGNIVVDGDNDIQISRTISGGCPTCIRGLYIGTPRDGSTISASNGVNMSYYQGFSGNPRADIWVDQFGAHMDARGSGTVISLDASQSSNGSILVRGILRLSSSVFNDDTQRRVMTIQPIGGDYRVDYTNKVAFTDLANSFSGANSFGPNNTNNGSNGSTIIGESSEINTGVGSALIVGEGNYIDGYGGIALGRGTRAGAVESFIGGRYVSATAAKTNNKAPQTISGAIGAFGWYITDTDQVAGHGIAGVGSAALGGRNHNIPSTCQFCVSLGGDRMKQSATDTAMVYASNLRIRSGIGTGTRMLTIDPNGYVGNQAIPGGGGGSGTVTSVSVTTANGVSGSVATSTTTPAITLSLGAITPTTVNGVTLSGSSTPTLAVTGTTTVSGTNTGDQTTISGNAGTATALQTARTINGTSFNGTANITVTADASTLTNTTLNSTVVSSSLTSLGTVATGTWQATAVAGQYGGTGVNNSGKTITLGGNLTTSGAFSTTLTSTAATNVTLPTTGTLAISSAAQTFTGTQTFSPVTGASGINVGSFAGNPSTLVNGDIWNNSSTNFVMMRQNGITMSVNPMTSVGDLAQGGTSGSPARLASVATGNVLISGGVTTASSWGKVALTTHVSGVLPLANGGTNQSSWTAGDILISNATNTVAKLAIGSTNQSLNVVSGLPAWSSVGVLDINTSTTTGSTITLDCNSQFQRMFAGSATFATAKTMAVSNTTNTRVFDFNFEVTNVAATLTLPSIWLMADTNFNTSTRVWTPPSTGKYEMSATFDGTNYRVKISGPFQ